MQSSSIEILAKLNYAHTPMKIEADKEIMIASLRLYCHSMQKLSTHQDKFQFVTPWNCNWKLSLLLWKSWMEIFPTLLRAQIKIKVWRDLLRKTQSSDFRWSSKVLVLWNFFLPRLDPHLKTVYFGNWTLLCHKFMTSNTYTTLHRAEARGTKRWSRSSKEGVKICKFRFNYTHLSFCQRGFHAVFD